MNIVTIVQRKYEYESVIQTGNSIVLKQHPACFANAGTLVDWDNLKHTMNENELFSANIEQSLNKILEFTFKSKFLEKLPKLT